MSAPSATLPLTLGGVSVTVGSLPAQILYVSPNQINALIPMEVSIPANTVVPLVVTSAAGAASAYNLRLTRNAPAIFTRNGAGTGRAFVFDPTFQAVDTVGERDVVILYATGLGPTNSSDGLSRVVDDVEVYIGDRKAEVPFAGLAPGFPGVYQLNVIAPAPATDRLYLRSGGWQSNVVNIGIRSGNNTANLKASIDGLFPSSDPSFPSTPRPPCVSEDSPDPCGGGEGLSVMLHAGTFSVSFDILPSAGAFSVAAVGEAGGSIISIDPAAGTYSATITTLTAAAARGDFSTSVKPLWDYSSCNASTETCFSFPDNTLPLARLSPFWVRATQMLPVPVTAVPANANGSLEATGRLSGLRFAIDDQNNASLSRFGGVVQVPYGPFDLRTSAFKLYVDGRLVASKDLPYAVVHR